MKSKKTVKRKARLSHKPTPSVESEVCKTCSGTGVGPYTPLHLIGVTCGTCYGIGRI